MRRIDLETLLQVRRHAWLAARVARCRSFRQRPCALSLTDTACAQAADNDTDDELGRLARSRTVQAMAWTLANRTWLLPYPQRTEVASAYDWGDVTDPAMLEEDVLMDVLSFSGRLAQPVAVFEGLATEPMIELNISATTLTTGGEEQALDNEFVICAIEERANFVSNTRRIALAIALFITIEDFRLRTMP